MAPYPNLLRSASVLGFQVITPNGGFPFQFGNNLTLNIITDLTEEAGIGDLETREVERHFRRARWNLRQAVVFPKPLTELGFLPHHGNWASFEAPDVVIVDLVTMLVAYFARSLEASNQSITIQQRATVNQNFNGIARQLFDAYTLNV